MAREVTHEEHGPEIFDEGDLEEQGGSIAICRCGLSDDQPFCDGSHGGTTDEEDGVVYKYEDDDDEKPRRVVEGFEFADEE